MLAARLLCLLRSIEASNPVRRTVHRKPVMVVLARSTSDPVLRHLVRMLLEEEVTGNEGLSGYLAILQKEAPRGVYS